MHAQATGAAEAGAEGSSGADGLPWLLLAVVLLAAQPLGGGLGNH